MPCSRCGQKRPAKPNPPSGARRPGTTIPGKDAASKSSNAKDAIKGLRYVPTN